MYNKNINQPKEELKGEAAKSRVWYGKKPITKDDDSDDDIFTEKKQVKIEQSKIEEFQSEPKQQLNAFQTIEQEVKIDVVDDDALMRRRRALQSRVIEEQQIQPIKYNDNKDELKADKKEKKKKKKEKKEKKEKEREKQRQNQFEQQLEQEEQQQEPQRVIELLKPVYVPKEDRDKLDSKIEEEIRLKEEQQRNLERKKLEAKVLILGSVQADANIKKNEDDSEDGGDLPNDDDTMDEKEYALWKIRELKRIKQYFDEKNKLKAEKEEIERRRNMTDMERIQEEFKLGSSKIKEDKTKYVFMQKYYHKGAYFQDTEDPIFQRDYNLPVGEDLFDKSKLPSIMQKRRGFFGKRGQSKYTHLTDIDTTDFNPEYQVDPQIRQKFLAKQAGSKQFQLKK